MSTACLHSVFPLLKPPDDTSEAKLSGVYRQRNKKEWMQRIKIPGGILDKQQWLDLANICKKHSPGTPMHLTTRQDIEFHNIPPERIPVLQKDLADAGFSGKGAGGDSLRNITICPGMGLCEGSVDFSGAAASVQDKLASLPGIDKLPRKFKISFSGCSKACAQPWINDLGFLPGGKPSESTLNVVGAGSLGYRPKTGIIIKKHITGEEIVKTSFCALLLFSKYGDRNNRKKARLRHVREQMGDKQFCSLFDDFLKKSQTDCSIREKPFPVFYGFKQAAVLNVLFGELSPSYAESIASLLNRPSVHTRLNNHHGVNVFAGDPAGVVETISRDRNLYKLTGGPDIVSCPGTAFCSHALVNTYAGEKQIRSGLLGEETPPVRISGCPNGCAHSHVAAIGLVGKKRKTENGQYTEGFTISTGGAMGRRPGICTNISSFVPSGEIVQKINELNQEIS